MTKIAEVTFAGPDRVRDVIHGFNAHSFEALWPKCKGSRPAMFTLPERHEIKKIAEPKPAKRGLPFSTVEPGRVDHFTVPEVVDDISHEGLRVLLCAHLPALLHDLCQKSHVVRRFILQK